MQRIYHWRNAILLGASFIAAGLVYLLLQGNGAFADRGGVTLLIVLGAAMMYTFAILLRGSRDL